MSNGPYRVIPEELASREALQAELNEKSLRIISDFQAFYKQRLAGIRSKAATDKLGLPLNQQSEKVLRAAKEASQAIMQVVERKYDKNAIAQAQAKLRVLEESSMVAKRNIDASLRDVAPI